MLTSEGLRITTIAAVLLAAGILVLVIVVETRSAEAAFPGANGKIAFSSNRTTGPGVVNPTGDPEIFTMNPNGTGVTQLTFNTTFDLDPAWSPDGKKIAFASTRTGDLEIYMMDPNGAQQTPLTNRPSSSDHAPTWSPDGKQIAFVSNFEIYLMDTDLFSNDALNLTNNPAFDSVPAWSPNRKKIAFASDRDGDLEIYAMVDMDPSTNDATSLTNNTAIEYNPNWSPSGRKIVFQATRGGDSEIFVMNRDGSAQKRLSKNAVDDVSPAWSPNGKKIAFASRQGGDSDIFVINRDGSRKRNLTNNAAPVNDTEPDWQPIVP